ncbi:MAG: transposase family protein [Deltaproteobacteria bacterium]|nr:transposase family protein [Deltaproteobacteria bacterium]
MFDHALRCPVCNSRHVIRRGRVWKRFRTTPIGRKAMWILLAVQRVYCRTCEALQQVRIGFANPRRSHFSTAGRLVPALS